MKAILFAIITGICSMSGWVLFKHAPSLSPDNTALTILIDKTDSFLAQADPDAICASLDLENHMWGGVKVRVGTVTSYDFSKLYAVTLPARFILLSNPTIRGNEIDSFSSSLKAIIRKINKDSIGRIRSDIYVPLITEANHLAGTDAKNKILIYQGDCEFNLKAFSVYNPKDSLLAVMYPDKVIAMLEQSVKPVNLHGVKVFIVFEPKSDRDFALFKIGSSLIDSVLTKAGAEVTIEANLVTQNN